MTDTHCTVAGSSGLPKLQLLMPDCAAAFAFVAEAMDRPEEPATVQWVSVL